MCLANNFLKKSDALDPQVLRRMNFKTSTKTSYLVATIVEQAMDKYILLDVLVCGIAEHFLRVAPYFDEPVWRVKIQTTPLQKCFTTDNCFEPSLFVKNVFNLIIKGGDLRLTLTDR